MIQVVAIDDEKNILDAIIGMLNAHCPDVEVVGTAGSIQEGLELLSRKTPDVLLLDIKLGDGTGFDLLSRLEEVDFEVVFVTAFDQFAIQAFKFSAFDYILKPFTSEDLIATFDRYNKQLAKNSIGLRYQNLVSLFKEESKKPAKLILNTLYETHIVQIDEIVACESQTGYTRFHMLDGSGILVSKTLNHYHGILGNIHFFKTHKSYLINLKYIKRLERSNGFFVVMKNDLKIPVATRRKEDLINKIKTL